MKYTVYALTFKNNAVYVGSTRDLRRRSENHLNRMRKGAHHATLQTAYNEYGAPEIAEVASGFSLETLHLLEAAVIETLTPSLNTEPPVPHEPSTGDSYGPYASKADAARALGCSYKTLKRKSKELNYTQFVNWLQSHLSKPPQQCLCPPDPTGNNTLIFHNGWHRRRDVAVVPIKTAKKRRDKGWSDWDSLVTPYGQSNPQRVQRVSLSAVCRRYGVDRDVYYQRRSCGWPVYEALGLRERQLSPRTTKVKQRFITADGKSLPLNVWAKKLGVTPGVIHTRLTNGWSEQDAVTVPKRVQSPKADKQPRILKVFTVQGFTGTISEIAAHYGIDDGLLRSRLAANWPDDALLLGKHQYTTPQSKPWGRTRNTAVTR